MAAPTRFSRRARRDRRGQGIRGSLLPQALPGARTSAERFDEVMLAAVARLDERLGEQLAAIEFGVEDVPSLSPLAALGLHTEVPLAHFVPSGQDGPARLVLYRRPIEGRAADRHELAAVIGAVLTEEVAKAFGLAPRDIDPDYPTD